MELPIDFYFFQCWISPGFSRLFNGRKVIPWRFRDGASISAFITAYYIYQFPQQDVVNVVGYQLRRCAIALAGDALRRLLRKLLVSFDISNIQATIQKRSINH
jgi:hypothetical protein